MLENLTDDEKTVMTMLIQGHNCNIIMEWLGIDYSYYSSIRKKILKKLAVNRTTELLKIAIDNDLM